MWGDHLIEVATWLVAWWSILYWAGWALHVSLWPLGWVWLTTSLLGIGLVLLRSRRRPNRCQDRSPGPSAGSTAAIPTPSSSSRRADVLTLAATTLSLVAAALILVAVRDWPRSGYSTMWGLTLVALLLGAATLYTRRAVDVPSDPGDEEVAATRRWEHLVAATSALGIGVLSLYINLADHDDPYYVNRSVWIAERGTALTRDTIFGPGTYTSPYNGGIPIASIEALVGVLSHMSGLSVGSLTWLVSTFVGAVGTVWALWALARRWAPRRPVIVLVVAVSFLLLSGESRLGNFWIARIWQGKVLALVILLPMIWVWADDLVRRGESRRLATMAVAGVAFVGLTSTAVILVPFITGGIVVAGLLLRHGRLVLGGILLAVGPVVCGIAVFLLSTGVGDNGALRDGPATFRRVLGPEHLMVAIALIAIALAPLLIRGRSAVLMVTATLLASLVVLARPLLELADTLTGSGPILWRVLYVVPIAVLVGLLAVVRLPVGGRTRPVGAVLAVTLPVILVGSFVWRGAPLWTTVDHNGPVTVTSSPTWKVDLGALDEVRAVLETDPSGVLLLPPKAMELLPMVTTRAYAVDPRGWYTRILAEPGEQNQARRLLARFIRDKPGRPTAPQLREALAALDVSLVCVQPQHVAAKLPLLEQAGYGGRRQLADLTCVTPPAGSQSD